ncbi:hypothetical protein [Devosia aurantiaca]|uniref:Uncharacterized protein n=1 Tax=Devosia aurantiaca TaxID=2714858 RepID=A0A6M1T3C9_9HYPH|nr:hypothetical protein [Devosia aurantiaca]NGP19321.1 hypothetical protein [Devosia aurantiaca]
MNRKTHTEGPWDLVLVGDSIQKFTPASSGMSILTLVEEGSSTFACVLEEADAWLIGASPELLEAAEHIVASRSDTYKARNGRDMGIQDESGEKMWIVPFEEMLALEAVIAKARGRS